MLRSGNRWKLNGGPLNNFRDFEKSAKSSFLQKVLFQRHLQKVLFFVCLAYLNRRPVYFKRPAYVTLICKQKVTISAYSRKCKN